MRIKRNVPLFLVSPLLKVIPFSSSLFAEETRNRGNFLPLAFSNVFLLIFHLYFEDDQMKALASVEA